MSCRGIAAEKPRQLHRRHLTICANIHSPHVTRGVSNCKRQQMSLLNRWILHGKWGEVHFLTCEFRCELHIVTVQSLKWAGLLIKAVPSDVHFRYISCSSIAKMIDKPANRNTECVSSDVLEGTKNSALDVATAVFKAEWTCYDTIK